MKIYISGKITGLPQDEARYKFLKAELMLHEKGYSPVNPMNNGLPKTATWHEHMRKDVVDLIECDAIYLLSDWHDSRGARLEKQIANSFDKLIIYECKRNAQEVQKAIHKVFGTEFSDLTGKCRLKTNVYARMIYSFHVRNLKQSTPAIAKDLHRDHSTVIYYLKRFNDEIKYNGEFREYAEQVHQLIND